MELSADAPFRPWRFLAAVPVIAVVTYSSWLAEGLIIYYLLLSSSATTVPGPFSLEETVKGIVTMSKIGLWILALPVSLHSLVLANIYTQCGPPYQFWPAFKKAFWVIVITSLISGGIFLFHPQSILLGLIGLASATVPAAASAWAGVLFFRVASRFDD